MFKLLLILFMLSLGLQASTLKDYYRLSEEQRAILHQAYLRAQPYDLGYTMAAFGWHESVAGKVRINTNFSTDKPSIDVGLYHLNSISLLDRFYKLHPKITRSHYLDNVLLHQATVNDAWASRYAVREFMYWRNRGRSYNDSIKSWNCGNNINRSRCVKYLYEIRSKVKILQEVYE